MFQVIIKHLRPFMRKNNNKITLRVTCKASNLYPSLRRNLSFCYPDGHNERCNKYPITRYATTYRYTRYISPTLHYSPHPKRLGVSHTSAHIAHPSARIACRRDKTKYDISLNTQRHRDKVLP